MFVRRSFINIFNPLFPSRFFPDTLLGSEEIEDFYNEELDAYYFDRHRGFFSALLFFYQSKGVFRSPTNIDRDIVEEELEYFKVQAEARSPYGRISGKW